LVIDESKLRIWRRPLHGHAYLYEYKCAATYDDVSAKAFLMAQVIKSNNQSILNSDFRWIWTIGENGMIMSLCLMWSIETRQLVQKLFVGWRDIQYDGINRISIYCFKYPMYPREYIYVRRVCIDSCENKMIMLSRAVDHHAYPITKTYLRVQLYSSNMVIRPHLSFDQVSVSHHSIVIFVIGYALARVT
jgi:hypothetical protein